MRVFFAVLPLFVFLAEGEKETEIDLSSITNKAAYSHCDCEKIKRGGGKGCSPACFLFCGLGGSFEDIQSFMDSECAESLEYVVVERTTSLPELKSVYRSAEEQVEKLKGRTDLLPKKEGCEHCSETSKVQTLTQPYIFKKGSCDEKYIGTHYFQKTFEVGKPEKCEMIAEEKKRKCKKIKGFLKKSKCKMTADLKKRECKMIEEEKIKAVQKYAESILKNEGSSEIRAEASRLHKSCPPDADCSWYINTIMTYNEDKTQVKLDLHVNCNHKKASLLGDYVVKISYKKERQCREKK